MLISAFTRVFNALCNDDPTIYGNRAAVSCGRPKIFYGKRGTPRAVAHWCWRNELYDPL